MTNVIQLTREQLRSRRFANEGRPRAKTESMKRITKRRLTLLTEMYPTPDDAPPRPRTRSDCVDGPRPCPWVACSHHLFLDVMKKSGAIKINEPGVEVEDMKHSCVLDIADEGERTLEAAARFLNVTRERIQQIETKALIRVKRRSSVLGEFIEERDRGPIRNRTSAGSIKAPPPRIEEDEEDDRDAFAPKSFFKEPHEDMALGARVSSRVFGMLKKNSGIAAGYATARARSRALAVEVNHVAARESEQLGESKEAERDEDQAVHTKNVEVAAPEVAPMVGTGAAHLTQNERTPMPSQLSPLNQKCLDIYRSLEKKLGHEPKLVEYGRSLGCEGDDKASAALAYSRRRALVDAGELPRRGPGGSKTEAGPSAKKTALVKSPPRSGVVSRPAPASSPAPLHVSPEWANEHGPKHLAITALLAERDKLAAKISGLDFAIATLGGVA